MQGQKIPLFEGEDGKLYYNFAQGLKVCMHGSDCDKDEEYTLEVVGCHYIGDTEYYDVERDGVQLPQPLSANRVKYLVSRYGVKTVAFGERQELPLRVEEVKNFYEFKTRQREKIQAEANKLTEYVAIKTAVRGLYRPIGTAEAFGRHDEANAWKAQQDELNARAAAVLKANGINPADVEEPDRCSKCEGKGYVFNYICECAIPHTQEIKAFSAEERRKLAKLTAKK